MSSRTNTFKLVSIVAVLLSVFMMSCQKPRQGAVIPVVQPTGSGVGSPEAVIANSNAGGGGVDGSGGNALTSTRDEVLEALKKNETTLGNKLKELHDKAMLWAQGAELKTSGPQYDWPLYLQKFFYGQNGNVDELVMNALEKGKIKFKYKEEDCNSSEGHRDGAASGSYENEGVICMSIYRLMRLPPASLPNEIFLLTVHELSHLSGFSEEAAVRLQQFVSDNPGFYQAYVCDQDQVVKQIEQLRMSPYWAVMTQKLLSKLEGTRDRICLETSDLPDATTKMEWFGTYIAGLSTAKLAPSEHKYYAAGAGNVKVWNAHWDNVKKTYRVDLKNSQGEITSITPSRNSNAYCSPKILLANMMANAEAALRVECTLRHIDVNTPDEVKKRQETERRILEGEKDFQSALKIEI